MIKILMTVLVATLTACSSLFIDQVAVNPAAICVGSTRLPPDLEGLFEPLEDARLLNMALGEPEQGKLCQGQVYVSKMGAQVPIFRAWNSTNPQKKLGSWWAFSQPAGNVARYRADYEICYQWSPLDKLVSCTLKPGTQVVVGNGQSASCSEFLIYPVSGTQQIFIEDAPTSVINCTEYEGQFSWKEP